MRAETERAYWAWQRAAERGYGEKTNIADLKKVDERILRLKRRYEAMLARDKASGFFVREEEQ